MTSTQQELKATDYNQPWITDTAWITGVTGTVAILAIGVVMSLYGVHLKGLPFLNDSLQAEKLTALLITLALVSFIMFGVELIRLAKFKDFQFINKSPFLANGSWLELCKLALKNYLLLLFLFFICRWLYHTLNEYGFKANHNYYKPWFYTLDCLWWLYIVAGYPYILLTQAFKHNPTQDKKDLATLTYKCLCWALSVVPVFSTLKQNFTSDDGKAARGLAVKFFFAPVMTVFFFDNFFTLLNNSNYMIINAVPQMLAGQYNYDLLGKDVGNILSNIIFTIDVGLAWCGYVISSRWVDNTTVSAEPTVLGWIVCLMSYPPFRVMGGWLVTGPGESLYTQIPNQGLVSLFGTLMMMSYFFYMLPTIWFGLRFSNLTHRGIIRKGPFAIVRHPAYAAKNLAWWLVGCPAAIYAGFHYGFSQGLVYFIGLIFITAIYFARAITEERHLSIDPDYVEYTKHVKYRFIPGLI